MSDRGGYASDDVPRSAMSLPPSSTTRLLRDEVDRLVLTVLAQHGPIGFDGCACGADYPCQTRREIAALVARLQDTERDTVLALQQLLATH